MAKNKNLNDEKKKKVPFNVLSKKGLVTLAMAGVMLATPFMLAGCSNGQDGKDGADGTVWKSGTSYTQFTDAKVGDYFIDTDDYQLWQKTADSWSIVMENYGKPSTTANDIEMQVASGNIQWRYKTGTDTEWKNLIEVATLNGANGYTPYIQDGYWYINNVNQNVKAEATNGKEIEIQKGTDAIQWRYEGDDEWTDLVALSLLKGDTGNNGTNGTDGKSVKIAVNEGNIQWRYTDDSNDWQTIIAIETLKGTNGTDGTTPHIDETTGNWFIGTTDTGYKAAGVNGKEIKLQVTADYIQWQYDGDETWNNLIPLSSLKGADGTDGATWISGDIAPTTEGNNGDFYLNESTYDIYKKTDGTWNKIGNIKGQDGTNGENGQDGSSWITGTEIPTSTTGKDGDTYLDITTNYIYTKTNGVWNKIGELSGDRDITIDEDASPWSGKTAVFVGDSITYGAGCDGDKYWEILEDELGLSQVTGMGVSGSCISAQSDYGTDKEPLINRYENIPQADLIQIFMGTNDYGHGTPLGTIDDTTDISFYGALNVILPALQAKYPTSRIVIVTPLHRYNANTTTQTLTYDYLPHPVTGKTLEDYVDALKEVCQRYSIPVIDLFNISGINPTVEAMKNLYMPDGIHPNSAGHELIANLMKYHLELYATSDEQTIVTPNYELELVTGNKFSTDSTTQTNIKRATTSKNIYLEKDTIINIKETSVYSMAVYSQTGETITTNSSISGGFVDTFTITESGYYGFVLSREDDADFNFSTMSKEFYDYVEIELPEQPLLLNTGNLFGTTTATDTTRATATKNIYLSANTTIKVNNQEKHSVAVYAQDGETIVTATNISGGYQTEFTITEDGWYGFVLTNTTEFDFSSDSQNFYDYVTFTQPQVIRFDNIVVETGSKYGSGYETNTARASSNQNVYLEAGTIISVSSENYGYGIYAQTGETTITTGTTLTSGWATESFTITESGYYGFAFKRLDNAEFDFTNTDSTELSSYITITIQVEQN